jgi:hypothetical protein
MTPRIRPAPGENRDESPFLKDWPRTTNGTPVLQRLRPHARHSAGALQFRLAGYSTTV